MLPAFGDKLGATPAGASKRSASRSSSAPSSRAWTSAGITIKDADGGTRRIEAATKVWAAGVQACPLGRSSWPSRPARRWTGPAGSRCCADLTLPGTPRGVRRRRHGCRSKGYPGVAQVAIQGGRYAAEADHAPRLDGESRRTRSTTSTRGRWRRSRGSAPSRSIGRLRFSGFVAWLLWLGVHLVYIIGFKHRVTTLLHWAVSFLGRGRSERTVTEQQVFGRHAIDVLPRAHRARRVPATGGRSAVSRPRRGRRGSAERPPALPGDRRRVHGRRVTGMPLDYPIHQRTLANGLRVVVSPDHTVPNVTVNIWVGVGSRHETPGRTGFAHLFEHLMFQGSRNVASGEHFSALMAQGARLNATTWFDRTNYFETVPTGALELALWLEADRHGHLLDAVTQENLDNQRDVVKEEKRQRYDNLPYGTALIDVYAAVFPEGHPYHHPTIGSMEDLDAATLEDVHAFFRAHYGPNNTVLTLVGDVTPEEGFAAAERYFGPLPPVALSRAAPTAAARPPHRARAASTASVTCPTTGCTWRSGCPSTRPTSTSPAVRRRRPSGASRPRGWCAGSSAPRAAVPPSTLRTMGFVDGSRSALISSTCRRRRPRRGRGGGRARSSAGFVEHGPDAARAGVRHRRSRAVLAQRAREHGGARRPHQPPRAAPRATRHTSTPSSTGIRAVTAEQARQAAAPGSTRAPGRRRLPRRPSTDADTDRRRTTRRTPRDRRARPVVPPPAPWTFPDPAEHQSCPTGCACSRTTCPASTCCPCASWSRRRCPTSRASGGHRRDHRAHCSTRAPRSTPPRSSPG